MSETLDLARTNVASGVETDDLKPIKDLLIRQHICLEGNRTLRPLRSQRQRSHKAVLMAEVR